jgi:tripartite-type tricarboxylate transporter receptor subunit TctC
MQPSTIGALLIGTGLSFACLQTPSWAEDYPARQVRLVVPYPAGGGVDAVARLVAERLSQAWGHPVIVENRAGANGNIGGEYVAKSPPDGYTALFSPSGVYTTAKLLYPNLPFDPDKDLRPVTLAAVTPNVIMVTPTLPVATLPELVAYAKARPGQVTYASQGVGSTAHLTAAYLAQAANLDLRHIPYRGAAPALTDVVAGHVTMTVDGLSSALGVIRGGTVRAVAVAGRKRSSALPNVPTAMEAGFADFESASWYGVTVPSGTPEPVVQFLSKAISHALHEPEIMKDLVDRGAEVIGSSPAELATYIKQDTARWKKVIDAARIKAE